ncbi:MAG: glycosyltransferase family 2 protein [Chitinophagales bacterium]
MTKFSFVVPAYNEEKNIPTLYQKVVSLMDSLGERDWELIFINDGSADRTWEILLEHSKKDSRVRGINLSRNFGHQAALGAGLTYARGDAIISMDCDLQDPPEVVAEMISKWKEGFKIVYARRLNYRKDNFIKRYASKFYYGLLDKFSEVNIPRNVGDFRLVDMKVQREMNKMRGKTPYFRGMVAWTGFKHTYVDYYRPDREEGESGYTLSKLIQLGMTGLLGFSFLPLKIGFLLGNLSILMGFGFLLYMIGDIIINDVYYHLYKFLVVFLFIFMGSFFILIWILGEYIGRIYDEVRNRPLYIVHEKVNFDEDTAVKL